MEEQFRPKETVGGSSPSRGTKDCLPEPSLLVQVGERVVYGLRMTASNLSMTR